MVLKLTLVVHKLLTKKQSVELLKLKENILNNLVVVDNTDTVRLKWNHLQEMLVTA